MSVVDTRLPIDQADNPASNRNRYAISHYVSGWIDGNGKRWQINYMIECNPAIHVNKTTVSSTAEDPENSL